MSAVQETSPRKRSRSRFPLGAQVLVAMIAGIIFGAVGGQFAEGFQVLGDAFIRLIEMVIIPLIFPLIVLGVATMKSARQLGRLGVKAVLYFEIVTTIVLIIAGVIAKVTHVGRGADLKVTDPSQLEGIAQSIDFKEFLLNIIPQNLFSSLEEGNLIAIVFFAIFFGIAMAHLGERVAPLRRALEDIRDTMFVVVNFVIKFAPIGVFGAMSYTVAHYGFGVLTDLLGLIATVYFGLAVVLFILFPVIARIFGVSWLGLMRSIGDLVLVAFATRSSESVLAPLIKRLEDRGVNNSVVSFILPLGYSFNLAGAGLYITTAVVFLSNGYGLDMSIGKLAAVIGILVLLTKGLSGVPSAAIVVLLATATAVGLPTEGVALLIGIDFILDMARTAVDTFGTPLAAVVIAKSEGLLATDEDSTLVIRRATANPTISAEAAGLRDASPQIPSPTPER